MFPLSASDMHGPDEERREGPVDIVRLFVPLLGLCESGGIDETQIKRGIFDR